MNVDPAPPRASVIVCAYNGAAVLPACLTTLAAQRGIEHEVIVVDNGSKDGSAEIVRRDFPQFHLIQNGRNLGFGSGNNVGIRAARGAALLLLNQDTEVPPDWVAGMTRALESDPKFGAVGCKLIYPGGKTIQHAGGLLFPNGLSAHQGKGEEDRGQWDEAGPRTYVTAAAVALRRSALEEIGLFDPGFDPAYYEEVDLMLRLWRAGWKVWYDPSQTVVHHESQVMGPGTPAMTTLYTRHRFRHLALNGLSGSRLKAIDQEAVWLADMTRKGMFGAALRGYFAVLPHWLEWRRDRKSRSSVPRLGEIGTAP